MTVSGRIYTNSRGAEFPVIGTKAYGGGLHLNPEEARFVTELLGRLEVVEGQGRLDAMMYRKGDVEGAVEYIEGAAKHAVAKEIVKILEPKTHVDASEARSVVRAVLVRGGLPPKIRERYDSYRPKTVDLEYPLGAFVQGDLVR